MTFTSPTPATLLQSIMLANLIRDAGFEPALPTGERLGTAQPGLEAYGIIAQESVSDPLSRRVYGEKTGVLIGMVEFLNNKRIRVTGFGDEQNCDLERFAQDTQAAFMKTADTTLTYDQSRLPFYVDVVATD